MKHLVPEYQEPYYHTPVELIDFKLKLAELQAGQLMIDLGCGNAAVMIRAVQQYGVKAIGYEILPEALEDARKNIVEAGLEDAITVLDRDFREATVNEADALVLYHGRNSLSMITQSLEGQFKSGAIIITHDFNIPGWEEEEYYNHQPPVGMPHEVYKYRVS